MKINKANRIKVRLQAIWVVLTKKQVIVIAYKDRNLKYIPSTTMSPFNDYNVISILQAQLSDQLITK